MQAYDVQSPQALFVRCCLYIELFDAKLFSEKGRVAKNVYQFVYD